MIVIGVDVHKQSLTAVAVDEVGCAVAELTVGSSAQLVAWSGSLDPERLWATVPEWHWQRLTTEQLSPLSFPSLDADLQ